MLLSAAPMRSITYPVFAYVAAFACHKRGVFLLDVVYPYHRKYIRCSEHIHL
jgi:hypothetical protein